MDPFLSIEDFEEQFRRTLDAGQTAIATRLLQVVSDWIWGRKSDVDEDAAAQVVFEVVRDALLYGDFDKLKSFTNTTADRTESGELDAEAKAVNDYLTPRHRLLLGIGAVRAAPRGSFKKCDY